MATSALPILIIGGGLAGLSLAQSLKHHSVPFVVFERDLSHTFRSQGYRIRITQEGGNALRSLLPPRLFDLFERTSAPVVPGMFGYDAVTAQVPPPPPPGTGPPIRKGKNWNADRAVLRNVLLKGLQEGEDILFGKKFQRYELVTNGVEAFFEDGTRVKGRMVVGADGGFSEVRKQLCPDAVIFDAEGRAVFGKTPIPAGGLEGVQESIEGGINLIRDKSLPDTLMSLFCDIMSFNREEYIAAETGVEMPDDYVYWVLVFKQSRAGLPDSKLMHLSNAASAQLAEKLTEKWHDSMRAIIKPQNPDAASTLALLMASPEMKGWQSDPRVTVLGDAAHLSIPVGGVGANSAFQDASELADVLNRETFGVEDIAVYESGILDRARENLKMLSGGGNFFGMKAFSDLQPVKHWN